MERLIMLMKSLKRGQHPATSCRRGNSSVQLITMRVQLWSTPLKMKNRILSQGLKMGKRQDAIRSSSMGRI